ncbi:hypothetical protein OH77DRAFT_1321432 [Trametes cingulata]|nr:hypothetical protein OH77DRAFT_1321432 [Trametes cingulata]
MAYGTRAKTSAASAQVAADLRQEESRRQEAEAKKAAIAQRIAELEQEMARQDTLRFDQAIVDGNVGYSPASAACEGTKPRSANTSAKPKKLSRADVEAAKHANTAKASNLHAKRPADDVDSPTLEATSGPVKKLKAKATAGPSGFRADWKLQRDPVMSRVQAGSTVTPTSESAAQSQDVESWSDQEEAPEPLAVAGEAQAAATPQRNTSQGVAKIKRTAAPHGARMEVSVEATTAGPGVTTGTVSAAPLATGALATGQAPRGRSAAVAQGPGTALSHSHRRVLCQPVEHAQHGRQRDPSGALE